MDYNRTGGVNMTLLIILYFNVTCKIFRLSSSFYAFCMDCNRINYNINCVEYWLYDNLLFLRETLGKVFTQSFSFLKKMSGADGGNTPALFLASGQRVSGAA